MAIYYMKFKYSINKYITGYTSIAYWWQTYLRICETQFEPTPKQ